MLGKTYLKGFYQSFVCFPDMLNPGQYGENAEVQRLAANEQLMSCANLMLFGVIIEFIIKSNTQRKETKMKKVLDFL